MKMCILPTLDPNIHVIAITGGPCGGKTDGMIYVREALQKDGYRVLVVPEVATKLIGGGMSPNDPKLGFLAFQRLVVTDIVHQEATFLSAARHFAAAGEKVVILADRGGIEGVAYLGGDEPAFAALVKEFGWQPGDLCEGRYHAAIHLVTAAIGAEKHYSLKNQARYETPEEAIAIDGRIARAWLRHPHLRVIDNRTDFPTKLQRLLDEVKAVLGEPVPLETEDRYLVRVDMAVLAGISARSLIVQDYLETPAGSPRARVRRRESADGYNVRYKTLKGEKVGRSCPESEQAINSRTYELLLETRDPRAATVVKDRHCFLYEGRFFELDRLRQPVVGVSLLEIERLPHESKDSIKLPPFVEVLADVSEDPRYSNWQIAINRSIPMID